MRLRSILKDAAQMCAKGLSERQAYERQNSLITGAKGGVGAFVTQRFLRVARP